MRFPRKLEKGATIGLVCTSSFVKTERIGECVKALENLGYKAKVAGNVDKSFAGYMAGTAIERAEWLNMMFCDPEVDAIFCMRGGDGSSRIMEHLDYELIKNNPKIFVGYSDVTNLHTAITKKCDLVTFHGPMVSSNIVDDFDEETAESLFTALNSDKLIEFKNPKGFDFEVLKEGKATGRIIGGNLSLLSAGIGTPYEVDAQDNILFIEEVCEPMSKIEKWGYHLRNAGILKKCSGIILGQFTKVVNEDMPEYDEIKTFEDILDGLDIPVMYNIQSGHGKPMMTIPMGAVCNMDTATKTITFEVER